MTPISSFSSALPLMWQRLFIMALTASLLTLAGCAGPSGYKKPGGGVYSGQKIAIDSAKRTEVALTALALLDTQYRYGGSDPATGFDCSGLVAYVIATAANQPLPRSTADLAEVSRPVAKEDLEIGDLVFFNTLRRRNSHVGIYLGDGRFINAPSSGGRVRIDSLSSSYFAKRFDGARTLFRP